MPSPVRRARFAILSATSLALLLTLALGFQSTSSAAGGSLAPGSFTGMGFDACAAPSATTMDKWMKAKENPYRAVGVYISGGLRACSQPNLTASWVSHVTSTGWHVLPLTVGPQASCSGFSKRVSDNPANTYAAAQAQGKAEAATAVSTATGLGIASRSTLFYDMESWHTGYDRCDASTLWFLSAWSKELHRQGYAAGVYSSGSTGIRLLDKMATTPPAGFVLPDHIWFAEWNDKETTSTSYISTANWTGHTRVHQFYGGHNATNGGVKLNIDSNWVDLTTPAVVGGKPTPTPTPKPTPKPTPTPTPKPTPKPTPTPTAKPTSTPTPASIACTRARITRTTYANTTAGSPAALVIAAQCRLRQVHVYTGKVTGAWDNATATAVRAFQRSVGLPQSSLIDSHTWTALLSAGYDANVRLGSSKPLAGLVALARALNAASRADLHGTGYFGDLTRAAVLRYQRLLFGSGSGVATAQTWTALHHGRTVAPPTVKARVSARASDEPSASPTASPSASPTASPTPSTTTDPPVAAGAGDPALAQPDHQASHRSIGVKAPTKKAAPALPKTQQLRVPRMVPAATPPSPVRAPLFSTALQAQMWTMMTSLNTHTQDVVAALVPWLADTGTRDGS